MTDKILITLGVIIIVLLIITMILATKKRDNFIPGRVNVGAPFLSSQIEDPMMTLGPNPLNRPHYSYGSYPLKRINVENTNNSPIPIPY